MPSYGTLGSDLIEIRDAAGIRVMENLIFWPFMIVRVFFEEF